MKGFNHSIQFDKQHWSRSESNNVGIKFEMGMYAPVNANINTFDYSAEDWQ